MARFLQWTLFCTALILSGCGGDIKVNDGTDKDGTDGPLGLFAIQSTQNIQSPNSPFGLWEAEESVSNGGNVRTTERLLIRPESTIKATRCRFPGGVNTVDLVAQVTTSSEIKNNRLVILESQEDIEYLATSGVTFECRSNLFATSEAQAPKLNIADGKMKMAGTGRTLFRKVGN